MDNQLEMLKRAKMYLEQLANGCDPLSGEGLPGDTILNNVRISRCFFFVAGVLQKVIDNGGEVIRETRRVERRKPFAISEEEKELIGVSEEPLPISKFCDMINSVVNPEKSGKLKVTAFGVWLVDNGYLSVETAADQKKMKKATAAGEAVGITSEYRAYGDRMYYAILYDANAQRFLLEHLDAIIDISNG